MCMGIGDYLLLKGNSLTLQKKERHDICQRDESVFKNQSLGSKRVISVIPLSVRSGGSNSHPIYSHYSH